MGETDQDKEKRQSLKNKQNLEGIEKSCDLTGARGENSSS
jgi:hypothetical protein